MIKVFLGIDVGTTKLKLTLMNREGEIIWKDSTNIHPIFGKNGEVEINPYDWIDALKKLSRNFDLSNVEAIGLSGQMHSLILIDKSGEPVRKAILWSDGRGKEIQAELEESYGREILERCGSLPFLSFTLVKLIYLLRNEKSSVERAHKFCLSKDFVGGWLTSNYNTEKTDASATLMMDIDRCEWCVNEILGGEIPDRVFPEIHDSMEVRGYLRKEAAEELAESKRQNLLNIATAVRLSRIPEEKWRELTEVKSEKRVKQKMTAAEHRAVINRLRGIG